jgi:hypothetical protein
MRNINIIVLSSAAALFVALLIVCGCENDGESPTDRHEPWVPLYNLKLAYNYGEPEAFEGIFAAEFEYIAKETPEGFPDNWNAENELKVIEKIARTADAIVLEISMSRDSIGIPKAGATAYSTLRMEARLRVYISDGSCLYTRGFCYFDLAREIPDSPWQIKTWYDETSANNEFIPDDATVHPMSWSGIKYYFYVMDSDNNDE